MYSSSYKHNNVANMDSTVLSGFGLKSLFLPKFTVCVVIHIQTSSITVFDKKWSSLCSCTDVSCVGESVWTVLKKEQFMCRERDIKRVPNMTSSDKTVGANCIWGVLCFLASCFSSTTDGYAILNMTVLSVIQYGNECAKYGRVCTKLWLQQWTAKLHKMWEISEWPEHLIPT